MTQTPQTDGIKELRAEIAVLLDHRATLDTQAYAVVQTALALGEAIQSLEATRLLVGASIDTVKEIFTATFPPPAP